MRLSAVQSKTLGKVLVYGELLATRLKHCACSPCHVIVGWYDHMAEIFRVLRICSWNLC